MYYQPSSRNGGGQPDAACKACVKLFRIGKIVTLALVAVVLGSAPLGCSAQKKGEITTPVSQLKLERVMNFYRLYTNEKKKPPANEQALKEFIRSLPQDQKEAAGIGDDIDSLFVSPRDGKKYVILYNHAFRPVGPTKAVAWEEEGKDGFRYVVLSMGYSRMCDQATFDKLKSGKK
jgi:hypothetical protein